ncbi:hypothetical protein AAFF_G00104740 [Aldrovandia affinis]|uniref:Uncharacterized protein n=1 Tax=Aldrovandia affinis TaxID=143900 RepID=A0AAD7T1V9_9TELE|nr:hypothetical protein AAFF_G00104740 [Aldrovandia affinis]
MNHRRQQMNGGGPGGERDPQVWLGTRGKGSEELYLSRRRLARKACCYWDGLCMQGGPGFSEAFLPRGQGFEKAMVRHTEALGLSLGMLGNAGGCQALAPLRTARQRDSGAQGGESQRWRFDSLAHRRDSPVREGIKGTSLAVSAPSFSLLRGDGAEGPGLKLAGVWRGLKRVPFGPRIRAALNLSVSEIEHRPAERPAPNLAGSSSPAASSQMGERSWERAGCEVGPAAAPSERSFRAGGLSPCVRLAPQPVPLPPAKDPD